MSSEVRKGIDRGHKFVFCSHPCRAVMIASQFDPPRPYNGEHTSGTRNAPDGRVWRMAVLERDGHTCQECGATEIMMNAHHIKAFSIYPALRYDVANGVTLCYECHNRRHSLEPEGA